VEKLLGFRVSEMVCGAVRGGVVLLVTAGVVAACAPAAGLRSAPLAAGSARVAEATLPPRGLDLVPPAAPSVQWGGQQGPQDANPEISPAHIITAATHPLATLDIPNASQVPETFTVDLFIADRAPPSDYYGSSTGVARSAWPGVIWDWSSQPTSPQDRVTVAPGTTIDVRLDWPQTGLNGRAAGFGNYWAVVTAVPTSDPSEFADFEQGQPIVLAKSLPPVPRKNCLGYPAAATVSGLPSPFPVTLEPGVTVPAAQMTFAGSQAGGYCELAGSDPEVGVLALTNPLTRSVRFAYHLVVTTWNEQSATAGRVYCDARDASPAGSAGTRVLPSRGVAAITLVWPHCSGNAAAPPEDFYALSVAASNGDATSLSTQIVDLES
jgi:hypothetical protein